MAGLANSSQSQYDSHLKAFKGFCESERFPDYLHAPVNVCIEFLTSLFKAGKSYSTINSARSALSHFVQLKDCPDNLDFGKHPLTTKFMKGVFKLRPPKPKYDSTWDAKIVLDHLRTLDINTVSLRILSLKCITLLALATGHRVQTLSSLSISNMLKFEEKFVFSITDVLKTSKPGVSHTVEIFKFPHDSGICPFTCLETYLLKTESIRNSDYVFISSIKPHRVVTSQTLSKWICETLRLAKVPFFFRAHSVRGAAASKAAQHLDVQVILSSIGWKSTSVFAKFYKKPISSTPSRQSFSTSILGDNQI